MNWQGTNLSQQAFFQQQDSIPVEISPAEPNLVPLQDFSSVGQTIHPTLAQNIAKAGYSRPTPVQKWGIPLLLAGKDVMACAQTGSGKTAFYLFPPINSLLYERSHRQENPAMPAILILGPTRELCVQIFEEAQKFTNGSSVKPAVVYGGTEYKESFKQLKGGADIVVATPGRLQDLCEKKACALNWIRTLILDEADRMLDMGFEPQIRQIVKKLGMPHNRQTVMTSATFPEQVQHLAQEFMRSYSFMAVGRVGGTASTIRQKLCWVEDGDKDTFLLGLLLHQNMLGLTLVFVNTKQQAIDLERFLGSVGVHASSIHGDRTQAQREDALDSFKSGRAPVLIATDVAARGLDIPNVACVIQYDLAMSVDDYVHRIGRTGRIGKSGISVGMVNNRNKGVAADLIQILEDGNVIPPAFLIGMAISTGNYFPGSGDGPATYGGQDVRKNTKRGFQTMEEREKAKRFTGFAKDAYGQGDEEQAKLAAQTIGPAMPGAYQGAASQGKGGKGKGKGKGGKDKSDKQDASSFAALPAPSNGMHGYNGKGQQHDVGKGKSMMQAGNFAALPASPAFDQMQGHDGKGKQLGKPMMQAYPSQQMPMPHGMQQIQPGMYPSEMYSEAHMQPGPWQYGGNAQGYDTGYGMPGPAQAQWGF